MQPRPIHSIARLLHDSEKEIYCTHGGAAVDDACCADPKVLTRCTASSRDLIIDAGNGTHTLHRVDTRPLFAAGAGVGARTREAPPPRAALSPLARFDCAPGRQFLPLGRRVEKIVSVDRHRHTVIFDTRTAAVRAGPDACHVKWHGWGSTWAEAGGRLYHLGRGPGHEPPLCLDFEALTYDDRRQDWFWSILPSPPLETYSNATLDSFADAGAGQDSAIIRITAWNETYAFDAARASWRKEGDWALPFQGRAQYVADYGLWFGFTGCRAFDLCAADLNAAGKPACQHVWANVDRQANSADDCFEDPYLSYLGSGRFCVTRFSGKTAIVTAVEATRAADVSDTGEMRMVSRASVRYEGPKCNFPCYSESCWAY